MTLDEAVHILKAGPKPGDQNYIDWQTASAVYAVELQRRDRSQKRLTTDAAPLDPEFERKFAKFKEAVARRTSSTRTRDSDESWAVVVTKDPEDLAHADLVAELPEGMSSYFVSVNPLTQKPALYRYRLRGRGIDPGLGSNGTRTGDYYAGLARQANTARELAGIKLRSINETNAKAWEKRDG